MNNKIFLATPISGFSSEEEYKTYRLTALGLIDYLRQNGYEVCSELEVIKDTNEYDSPEKSVEDDFKCIRDNDYFILMHPARMQTSSLIEYGYACACNKKIVAVGKKTDFPYLVIGYEKYSPKAKIVEIDQLNEDSYKKILAAINSLS